MRARPGPSLRPVPRANRPRRGGPQPRHHDRPDRREPSQPDRRPPRRPEKSAAQRRRNRHHRTGPRRSISRTQPASALSTSCSTRRCIFKKEPFRAIAPRIKPNPTRPVAIEQGLEGILRLGIERRRVLRRAVAASARTPLVDHHDQTVPPSMHPSRHQPSRTLRLSPPLSAAFIPLAPDASIGGSGGFSHTSTPATLCRAMRRSSFST